MTTSQNSIPRTNIASSIEVKSQENPIKAHTTDTRSRPARSGLDTSNVAPQRLGDRDVPNRLSPLGSLPETGYVRKSQLIPAIFPFWRKVKAGAFPQPVKLGPRITAWRVEDIRGLIERLGR